MAVGGAGAAGPRDPRRSLTGAEAPRPSALQLGHTQPGRGPMSQQVPSPRNVLNSYREAPLREGRPRPVQIPPRPALRTPSPGTHTPHHTHHTTPLHSAWDLTVYNPHPAHHAAHTRGPQHPHPGTHVLRVLEPLSQPRAGGLLSKGSPRTVTNAHRLQHAVYTEQRMSPGLALGALGCPADGFPTGRVGPRV